VNFVGVGDCPDHIFLSKIFGKSLDSIAKPFPSLSFVGLKPSYSEMYSIVKFWFLVRILLIRTQTNTVSQLFHHIADCFILTVGKVIGGVSNHIFFFGLDGRELIYHCVTEKLHIIGYDFEVKSVYFDLCLYLGITAFDIFNVGFGTIVCPRTHNDKD